MSKVLACCRQKGFNFYSKLCKYFLPNLHKSSFLLKLGICVHSHVPEFIELKNSRRDLNSKNLLSEYFVQYNSALLHKNTEVTKLY